MGADELAQRIRERDRRALSQAITLVESTRADHRQRAEALVSELLPLTGGAHRIALSGPPGAGKSTLVDALGALALEQGRRVAVLAIDPASSVSGGSLLGDAVRMRRLAASEKVFLRSSSNLGKLGGTAPGTRESVLLCEAAGFDVVLIETVGVGQAEQAVRDTCDTLLLLALSGSGDEVQAIKRGLLEVADAVIVTKADGPSEEAALAHAGELGGALALLRRENPPHVSAVSAVTERGVAELWRWLDERIAGLRKRGELAEFRQTQLKRALRFAIVEQLEARASADRRTTALLPRLEAEVERGERLPSAAARELVSLLLDARP